MTDKVVFLGLNEINFDFVKYYADQGVLPHFKKLLDQHSLVETTSEDHYEYLEPWIQWVTISTGLNYAQHKIFRLGDIVERPDLEQIYERIESKGYKVGAISPFNSENRLKHPAFFVSDPWTRTQNSGSPLLVQLGEAVSQAVNDNAHNKITIKSIFAVLASMLLYSSFRDYFGYVLSILKIKKKGMKAIFLDKILGNVFIKLWKKTTPDFSHLFLNSGAHLQHHYMFNSAAYKGDLENPAWYCPKNEDPIKLVLQEYDRILGKISKLPVRIVVATGLHQQPHRHVTFYWRLKDHADFLNRIGIYQFVEVLPRMSRDFLLRFNSANEAKEAEERLTSLFAERDSEVLFKVDNREKSLFVELIYSKNIESGFKIKNLPQINDFKDDVSFVAIKNGEHNGIGYYLDTGRKSRESKIPLENVFHELVESFN